MPYTNKKDLYRNQIRRWQKRKEKAVEYKGGCCQNCGYSRCKEALQFHHVDPLTKEANWNKIRLWSWDKVLSELDKCALLCANCHAEVHAGVSPLSSKQMKG